jgi:hypothetical protein
MTKRIKQHQKNENEKHDGYFTEIRSWLTKTFLLCNVWTFLNLLKLTNGFKRLVCTLPFQLNLQKEPEIK